MLVLNTENLRLNIDIYLDNCVGNCTLASNLNKFKLKRISDRIFIKLYWFLFYANIKLSSSKRYLSYDFPIKKA